MRAQTCELSEKFFLFGGFLEPAFFQNVFSPGKRRTMSQISDAQKQQIIDGTYVVRTWVAGWPKIPLSSDEEDKDKEEPGRLSSTPRRPAHGTHLPPSLPYRI